MPEDALPANGASSSELSLGSGDRSPVPLERTFSSVSIVIPTYNEAESLPALHEELVSEMTKIGVPFEIIFVDDGSTDDTVSVLRQLCGQDDRVRFVRLRRNFGKAAALSEGFSRSTGDVVVTMDGDLQDNPAEVKTLLAEMDRGVDLVSGWKWPRKDPLDKRLPSKLFNFAVRWGSGLDLHDVNCGLKAYRKTMLDGLSIYGDMHRYIPVLADAQGFEVSEVKVSHRPRQYGKSKYSVGRYGRGFLDFLTVLFLTRYRRRPLHLIGGMGLLMGLSSLALLFWLTIGKLQGTPIAGRPLFFLGILLAIVSVQLITFGLLAEMVTSFFLERHNDYPVSDEGGFEDNGGEQKNTD